MKIFIYALKCWGLSGITSFAGFMISAEIIRQNSLYPTDPIGLIMVSFFLSCAMLIAIIVTSSIVYLIANTFQNFRIIVSLVCFGIWFTSALFLFGYWFFDLLNLEILFIPAPILGLLTGIWIFKLELKNSDVAMEHEDILDADI